jgi:hypothetical protein
LGAGFAGCCVAALTVTLRFAAGFEMTLVFFFGLELTLVFFFAGLDAAGRRLPVVADLHTSLTRPPADLLLLLVDGPGGTTGQLSVDASKTLPFDEAVHRVNAPLRVTITCVGLAGTTTGWLAGAAATGVVGPTVPETHVSGPLAARIGALIGVVVVVVVIVTT